MKDFVVRHKIFVAIMVLLIAFIGFNLWRERSIKRVSQTNTPTVEEVNKALQNDLPEQPAQEQQDSVLRTGTFVNGAKAYKGSGTARIIIVNDKPVLQLRDDFSSSSGPDLQVYLSPNPDPKNQGLGDFVTLGGLMSTSGAQVYNLPDNHADYKSVVIYCRAFVSLFSQATLSE